MNNKLTIHELMDRVLSDLKLEKYADYTISSYRHCYNGLVKFIELKNVVFYSNALAIDYVRHKFDITIDGLYVQCPSKVHSSIRALKILSDYSEHGAGVKKRRFGGKPFECPDVFSKDYESFKLECKSRNYAPMGEASLFWSLHKFLIFMNKEGLVSSSEMTSVHILKFLTSYKDYSTRLIASTISRLRNYLNFLFQEGIIKQDLCRSHMRITRNPFIPSVWEQTDVKKLLESIDRQNPKGKRDYAILCW